MSQSEVGGLLSIYEDSRLINRWESVVEDLAATKNKKAKEREKAKGKVHHWLTGSLVQPFCWCSTIPR